MSETEEQERSAIDQAFRHVLIQAFIQFYTETGDKQSKWGEGAVMRFRHDLIAARCTRVLALKMIEETKP